MYDLWSKNVKGIVPSEDGFTVTNTSVELTPAVALLLRFRRSFDATFTLNAGQVPESVVAGCSPEPSALHVLWRAADAS